MFSNAPASVEELLLRSQRVAGKTLAELASELDETVPANLLHAKGWVGQLLEKALGATASTLPEPDFQQLGIELKTLPVNQQGQPRESTYVCTVPLQNNHEINWEQSWVRNKLRHVLWVPIEAESSIPVAQRHIGQAILWQPDPQQEAILKQDWEEHMDKICTGQLSSISARDGQYLQIRPKAASSSSLMQVHGEDGQPDVTLPRGFYLRTSFTAQILKTAFHHAAI